MTSYVGKAPLTLARTTNGTSEYVYAGVVAPENLDPEDAKRLADEGFLEKVGSPAKAAKAASTPARGGRSGSPAKAGEVPPAPEDPGLVNAQPVVDGPAAAAPAAVEAPLKAASKEAWVEFAVGQGADRGEAEGSSKQQLIDAYGA